ncbi:hypothetical protein BC829DRAFT_42088 [Chytridium lagenaria]|nr:hypothetical protein BC829DRAFT_42088 [Chytridium lagenaria]
MHLNRILLAATALYATSLSLVSSQVTDEVYYDIFSNPKHQVVFGTLPGHLPITPATLSTIDLESNPSLLLLPDASTGKRYLCHVPQPPELDQETSKANSDDEKKKTLRSGLRLLEPMAGKDCLYYVHSWWTYEFCHNRHVRQYHPVQKKKRSQIPNRNKTISLGSFPALLSLRHLRKIQKEMKWERP